jgi:hypothetical protein
MTHIQFLNINTTSAQVSPAGGLSHVHTNIGIVQVETDIGHPLKGKVR